MKKIDSKTVLLTIALIFVQNSLVEAQKSPEPVITKKVAYLKTRDKQLEKAIRKWNGTDSADEVRYHYNKVDLNGDKKLDAVVYNSGKTACGTGGCDMLIFKGVGKGYQLVTQMSVSRTPLVVLSTKSKGWKNLAMLVSGGGIKPYYSFLKFNGKTYPENPTVEPEIPKRARGVEYLSEIEDYNTGFLIK